MAVQRAISLYDLMQYKEAKEAIKNEDKKALEKILYSLGLDTTEPYQLEDCYHRPLTQKGNDPWFGGRYVGNERQDYEYLKSGNSTWENQIDACSDDSMRAEIKYMSRSGADAAFRSKDAGAKAVREEKKKVKGEED